MVLFLFLLLMLNLNVTIADIDLYRCSSSHLDSSTSQTAYWNTHSSAEENLSWTKPCFLHRTETLTSVKFMRKTSVSRLLVDFFQSLSSLHCETGGGIFLFGKLCGWCLVKMTSVWAVLIQKNLVKPLYTVIMDYYSDTIFCVSRFFYSSWWSYIYLSFAK